MLEHGFRYWSVEAHSAIAFPAPRFSRGLVGPSNIVRSNAGLLGGSKVRMPFRSPLALLVAGSVVGLIGYPGVVSATTETSSGPKTLHLFQQVVTRQVVNGRGHALSAHTKLASGDRLMATYREFNGNHRRHGRQSVGSGAMTCSFTSRTHALCTATISVSGSSVLANRVPVDFLSQPVDIAVNGGTGSFAGMRGLISSLGVGTKGSADLTIVVAPRPGGGS